MISQAVKDSCFGPEDFGPSDVNGRLHTPCPEAVRRLHRLVGHGRRRGAAQRGRVSDNIVTNLRESQRRKQAEINAKNTRYPDALVIRAHKEHYQMGASLEASASAVGIAPSTLRRRWRKLGAPVTPNVAERGWSQ